jgi:putative hydrolase of the HAD superfamily
MARYRALLFDIGEVVSAAPWRALDQVAAATGRSFEHRGPDDPDHDPLWQRYLAGELSYVGYWAELATAAGYDDWKDLYRDVGRLPVEQYADPDAADLIAEVHAAGLKVGALTNEGAAINGMGFFETVPAMAMFDTFVDAAEFGEKKPAPESYLRAAEALGLDPGEIVFLDDTPVCVWGADEVGMHGVLVDPADRRPAFDHVRELVGLVPAPDPRHLVTQAERAYLAQDVDAIMSMFDPNVVIVWNGERVAVGHDEARAFHEQQLGFGDGLRDFQLSKRLRAVDGDTLSVEYRSSFRRADGSRVESVAGEFWRLHRDKLVEWHCYQHVVPR